MNIIKFFGQASASLLVMVGVVTTTDEAAAGQAKIKQNGFSFENSFVKNGKNSSQIVHVKPKLTKTNLSSVKIGKGFGKVKSVHGGMVKAKPTGVKIRTGRVHVSIAPEAAAKQGFGSRFLNSKAYSIWSNGQSLISAFLDHAQTETANWSNAGEEKWQSKYVMRDLRGVLAGKYDSPDNDQGGRLFIAGGTAFVRHVNNVGSFVSGVLPATPMGIGNTLLTLAQNNFDLVETISSPGTNFVDHWQPQVIPGHGKVLVHSHFRETFDDNLNTNGDFDHVNDLVVVKEAYKANGMKAPRIGNEEFMDNFKHKMRTDKSFRRSLTADTAPADASDAPKVRGRLSKKRDRHFNFGD